MGKSEYKSDDEKQNVAGTRHGRPTEPINTRQACPPVTAVVCRRSALRTTLEDAPAASWAEEQVEGRAGKGREGGSGLRFPSARVPKLHPAAGLGLLSGPWIHVVRADEDEKELLSSLTLASLMAVSQHARDFSLSKAMTLSPGSPASVSSASALLFGLRQAPHTKGAPKHRFAFGILTVSYGFDLNGFEPMDTNCESPELFYNHLLENSEFQSSSFQPTLTKELSHIDRVSKNMEKTLNKTPNPNLMVHEPKAHKPSKSINLEVSVDWFHEQGAQNNSSSVTKRLGFTVRSTFGLITKNNVGNNFLFATKHERMNNSAVYLSDRYGPTED
ncbi:hypothetical protein EAI_04261 [Harpegnathos saltator]|uniref:Uncharacterized protein n=1 Tax=Harpegnathos saltator TaxID=610380 RepID=E2BD57_HARSA|nr:hypothetical protein EAI_04261 [Harpegnathos saltator]